MKVLFTLGQNLDFRTQSRPNPAKFSRKLELLQTQLAIPDTDFTLFCADFAKTHVNQPKVDIADLQILANSLKAVVQGPFNDSPLAVADYSPNFSSPFLSIHKRIFAIDSTRNTLLSLLKDLDLVNYIPVEPQPSHFDQGVPSFEAVSFILDQPEPAATSRLKSFRAWTQKAKTHSVEKIVFCKEDTLLVIYPVPVGLFLDENFMKRVDADAAALKADSGLGYPYVRFVLVVRGTLTVSSFVTDLAKRSWADLQVHTDACFEILPEMAHFRDHPTFNDDRIVILKLRYKKRLIQVRSFSVEFCGAETKMSIAWSRDLPERVEIMIPDGVEVNTSFVVDEAKKLSQSRKGEKFKLKFLVDWTTNINLTHKDKLAEILEEWVVNPESIFDFQRSRDTKRDRLMVLPNLSADDEIFDSDRLDDQVAKITVKIREDPKYAKYTTEMAAIEDRRREKEERFKKIKKKFAKGKFAEHDALVAEVLESLKTPVDLDRL